MDKVTIKWWVEHSSRMEAMYDAASIELLEYKKALNYAVTALITSGWMIDKDYPMDEVLQVIDDAIIGYRGFMEDKFPNGGAV